VNALEAKEQHAYIVQAYHETHTHTRRKVQREREREADKANLEKPNRRSGTEGAKVELKRRMMMQQHQQQQPNLMFPTQI
jgi:hypothetical protein